MPTDLPDGTVIKKLASNGVFMLNKVQYMVDGRRGFQQVLVITAANKITVADLEGEILIEHTRPAPGVTTSATATPAAHAKPPESSPMS
jgi:hypothetical protein